MNEISKGQELYLKNCRKHKRIVQISRILILFSFLFLWEFTANTGIIDSSFSAVRQRLLFAFEIWQPTRASFFISESRCMRP